MGDPEQSPGHGTFAEAARGFKQALIDAECFTEDEIAAMLGSFVLSCYHQHLAAAPLAPEMSEMLAKQNILNDHLLADLAEDDE